jgi:nitrogenase molybdenum-cofactor synthesis protein NifE
LWCYFYALRYLERAKPDIGKFYHGTQPDNNAVIYGTEKFLLEELELRKKSSVSSIMLIENSCSVSLIGDDIAGIARKADMPCPVICFDSGGLLGTYCQGYSLVGIKCLQELMPRKNLIKKAKRVNILGMSLGYLNDDNDLMEIKRILILAGYEIGACFGDGATVEEIMNLTTAEFNLVIHEELGLEIAKFLEKKYDMPYISSGVPYGLEGTLNWLNTLPGYTTKQEITDEAEKHRDKLFAATNEMRLVWGELWYDNIIVSGPSTMAFSLAEALRREWVDTGKLTVMLQDVPIKKRVSTEIDELLIPAENMKEVETALMGFNNGLVMGSSSETVVLQRNKHAENIQICNIAYPLIDELLVTSEPFMGFRGAAHMLQRLWNGNIAMKVRR